MESKVKFVVGDRVVVTQTTPVHVYPNCTQGMCNLAGQEFTVEEIRHEDTICLSGSNYLWHPDWLALARVEMI